MRRKAPEEWGVRCFRCAFMNRKMRVLVTCGPGYEPVDAVRRLTNFSTGQLGLQLAGSLAASGHEVICLRGVGATSLLHPAGVQLRPFTTNDNLVSQLGEIRDAGGVDAVLQVAALCDFRVAAVEQAGSVLEGAGKICSRSGELLLRLVPAEKVLGRLRGWFPKARLVGWKYEVEGGRDSALAKGSRQMLENATDACVVNGPAYGEGYGWMERGQEGVHLGRWEDLAGRLLEWLPRGV
jgi:phosphopantothenoylcysteine synthetase/decarboxylase